MGKGRIPTQPPHNFVVLLRLVQKESFATAHKYNTLTRSVALCRKVYSSNGVAHLLGRTEELINT